MWRFGIGGFNAFQFDGVQCPPLLLELLFQMFNCLALFDDYFVQLINLMFEMRDVRFKSFDALDGFVRRIHIGSSADLWIK